MEPASLAITTGKVIYMGTCLAIGFWIGKKITNRIDEFIITHSSDFKELTREKKQSDPLETVGLKSASRQSSR